MHSRRILAVLIAPTLLGFGLSGCAAARHVSSEINRRFIAADLELTSPLPHVRVEAGRLACSTPCVLHLAPGRYRLVARDPYGRMDFTYQFTLAAGLAEFEVFPGATPP